MKVLKNPAIFYGILFIFGLTVSIGLYLIPPKGSFHTNYNDYIIFKQSFINLLNHVDLYYTHEADYNDLYKYTPSFAMFMVLFAYLPNIAGLILWNTLNLFILFFAFRNFPFATEKKKLLAAGFILVSALTSTVFTQCNCIMAALLILTYEFLEKKKILWATLFVTICVFIKPYGMAGFILFLFYPEKIKAFAYTLMWGLLITALPLLSTSPSELIGIYKSWLLSLKTDHDQAYGVSLLGLMHSWFGFTAKNLLVAIGLLVLVLPLIRYKAFSNDGYKSLFLASILIWVIIFNHRGETPGLIIAVSGVAIWYFNQPYSKWNLFLLLLAFLFTVLEPTDIFPQYIRRNILTPYVICIVPCVLIWVKIIWELMTKDFGQTQTVEDLPKDSLELAPAMNLNV